VRDTNACHSCANLDENTEDKNHISKKISHFSKQMPENTNKILPKHV